MTMDSKNNNNNTNSNNNNLVHQNSFGPPEITPEDISFDETYDKIGSGAYGTVYRALCRGHEVAVKKPHLQRLTPATLASFQEEVRKMSTLSHPNLIRLMGACTVPDKLQIVTERCVCDLAGLLADPSYHGTLYDRLKMVQGVAKGMVWLHDISKIIHSDLKPANLLIDYNKEIKITDFGFSQIKKDVPIEDTHAKGTLMYMAPEKMLNHRFSEKADVFSFGVILWEVIRGQKPYSHHTDVAKFMRAICIAQERPPLTEDIPISLQILIKKCWDHNPDARCSFREILNDLNSALVDCVVHIPLANAFWKNKFLKRENCETVEWSVFKDALKEEIVCDDLPLEPVKRYLVKTIREGGKDLEVVTLNKFDLVTKWFGPFYLYGASVNILNEVNYLSQQLWFHGDISSQIANTCLSGKPRGTFLVRLSHTNPLRSPFTLSLPNNHHTHLLRTPTGLLIDGQTFPSLEAFLNSRNELIFPCTKEYSVRYTNALSVEY